MIGELFSKYQPGTKRTCLIIVILRQLDAVTLCLCSTLPLVTTQTPTVCYSVPSIVEVSGGCQYIMSAQPRDYCSEIICILRKIHRLRKHPWISAQTIDDNGSIDCAGRSMDCADPQIAPNTSLN